MADEAATGCGRHVRSPEPHRPNRTAASHRPPRQPRRVSTVVAVSERVSEAMSRIHLVVLYGGQSAEHDVSCSTASHVLAAIDPARYRVTPIGISTSGEWALGEAAQIALAAGPAALPERLDPSGPAVSASEVLAPGADDEVTVVLPLLHGPMGEDGTVQGMLELANVAYVGGGVLGSALAMDKAMAKQVLAANGIAQARFRALREDRLDPSTAATLADELGLPCFVKPSNMGSSVGVSKAHDLDELSRAIEYALSYDEWVVVEEAVVGREIEVAVLGGTDPIASPAGEIVPGEEFYSYEDKYVTDGATLLIPAPLADAASDEVRAPRRAGVRGAARRGPGPDRLLLRGGRPRLPVQRGQHDAGVHADLDVPEAVAGRRAVVPGAGRPPRRAGGRAGPPSPAQHQALTVRG